MTPKQAYEKAQDGFKAYSEKRFNDAEQIADQILKKLPQDPNGLYLKGINRRALKDPETALEYIQKATSIAPGVIGFEVAVAQVLGDLERYDEAINCYQLLMTHFPDEVSPRLRLGGLFCHLRQTDKAREALEAGLFLQPHNPELHFEMAKAYQIDQNVTAMIAHADQVLVTNPNWLDAILLRAYADMMQGQFQLVVNRLSVLTGISPAEVSKLTSLLGDAYDELGEVDKAIETWDYGNIKTREQFLHLYGSQYSPSSLNGVKLANRYFTKRANEAVPSEIVSDKKSPIFLVGFPRSGTTLIEQILSAHPDVFSSDERDCLGPVIHEYCQSEETLDKFFNLDSEKISELQTEYWKRVESAGIKSDSTVFLDKSPLNLMWLAVIGKLFPDAHIILAVRDPRDAVFASYRRTFSMNAAMFHMLSIKETAEYYATAFSAAYAGTRLFPSLQVHQLKYEDIINDLEITIKNLINNLNLPFDESVLKYRDKLEGKTISTPSANQVIQPLFSSAIGKWKPYSKVLDPVADVLKPWVTHFEYQQ